MPNCFIAEDVLLSFEEHISASNDESVRSIVVAVVGESIGI